MRLLLEASYDPATLMSDSITKELTRNREVFERLVRLADGSKDKGHDDLAVGYAQVAAQFAWHNHPGLLASRPLERILGELGQQRMQDTVIDRTGGPEARSPRSLLHVMSAAYAIGGHTRFVKRWAELDPGRAHSVVLTQQGSTAVPAWLVEAVRASGGTVHFLDRKWGGLLSRVDRLRKLAQKADLVVLHIHPSDAVPIVAFADKKGIPPVVLMNHADHVFWLGTSTGDVVANIRQSAIDLSCDRRGISRTRCAILPVPIEMPRRTIGQKATKKALGLSHDSVVLLSVASEYKYTALGGMSFLTTLMPVLENCSNARLLVIGPQLHGEWEDATRKLPGRIRVLGAIEDPSPYYEAADIYIDSFPFGSLTSLLEAGSYGMPVISFCPFTVEAGIFRPDDPAIEGVLFREAEVNQYRARLVMLIRDSRLRAELGEKTKRNILKVHTGAGWREYVQTVYRQAASQSGHPSDEAPLSPQVTQLDSLLIRFHFLSGFSSNAEETVKSQIEFFPLGRRLAFWLQVSNPSRIPLRRALFPDWVRTCLKGLVTAQSFSDKHGRSANT